MWKHSLEFPGKMTVLIPSGQHTVTTRTNSLNDTPGLTLTSWILLTTSHTSRLLLLYRWLAYSLPN